MTLKLACRRIIRPSADWMKGLKPTIIGADWSFAMRARHVFPNLGANADRAEGLLFCEIEGQLAGANLMSVFGA